MGPGKRLFNHSYTLRMWVQARHNQRSTSTRMNTRSGAPFSVDRHMGLSAYGVSGVQEENRKGSGSCETPCINAVTPPPLKSVHHDTIIITAIFLNPDVVTLLS